MDLKIFHATTQHAETIAFIGRHSFTATFEPLFINKADLSNYVANTYSTQRVKISLAKPNNIYFLGTVNGQPAGFAKLKIGSSHPAIDKENQCELQRIYVLNKFHGSGIAQYLITAIIGMAKTYDAQFLWLDVHIHDERAKNFYQRNGFVIAGDHRFTIGSQEFSYYVMELDLKDNNSQKQFQPK